ncbi:MAG TPA: ATP-binding protein [Candidatus Acidoferrales bacterium]|nr:ATP-binding protein [Candidatus Acidoferrales bacterium]
MDPHRETAAKNAGKGVSNLPAQPDLEMLRMLVQNAKESDILMPDPEGRMATWMPDAQSLTSDCPGEVTGGAADREVTLLTLELEQRVAERTAQLARSNQKLLTEVGERLRAEVAIRDLNRTLEKRAGLLEAANEELEAFSSSVSHDLRNPLAQILGFATLLDEDFSAIFPEKRRAYIAQIRQAARKMTALIDDLLCLSRSSRVPLVLAAVDLNQLVSEIVADLKSEEKGRVEWLITALPTVRADASLLRQVYVNLLGNALKYSRSSNPARIEIGESESTHDKWMLYVRDNGVGFDGNKKDRLFGPFQRLHSAQEFEGTGLGLVNVKRIVIRHGGKVWAQSRPGGGAVFYFTLPKGQSDENGTQSSGGSR